MEEVEQRVKQSNPKQVSLPTLRVDASNFGNSSTSDITTGVSFHGLPTPSIDPKRRKGAIGSIEKAFNVGAHDIVDNGIARMFCTKGLSFHFARNPYYVRTFKSTSQLPSYILSGYNSLRITLLRKEKGNIENLLEPIKKTLNEEGVSICNDRWSGAQRRSLFNIMAVSESGPIFFKAINYERETKDKHFIANLLTNTIQYIGPRNVVQVITDNVVACKAVRHMWKKISAYLLDPLCGSYFQLDLKNICAPSTHPRYDDVMGDV